MSKRQHSVFFVKYATILLTGSAAAWAFSTADVQAEPQGGKVIAGNASIIKESAVKTGIIQSTNKAIINWQSFGIKANEQVQFYQPSTGAIALNRVVGQDPSKILGRLNANGNVWLINRNGILFGKDARIDVNGLVATTNDIRNKDFLAGRYNFTIPGNPNAAVVNAGNITIGNQGLGAFVAPSVKNSGIITAKLGKVGLAAANGFTLDMYGDGLISLAVSDEVAKTAYDTKGNKLGSFVKNEGKINADGGLVLLTAKAARGVVNDVVNNTGVIEARSVSQRGGVIILGGGRNGTVRVSGRINASGKKHGQKGGKVHITGEKLALINGAKVDVSGSAGGGTLLLGGDYQGKGTVQTATYTYVEKGVSINADAINDGDGGKVIVWADEAARVYGTISAKGGKNSGNGGFVETSGLSYLDTSGDVDVSAVSGNGGTWLLDPASIIINNFGTSISSGGFFDPGNSQTTISAGSISTVLNRGSNVRIQTGPVGGTGFATITLNADILKTAGGTATLRLLAYDGIVLNARILSTSGKLNLIADADFDRKGAGDLIGNSASGYVIDTNGGDATFSGQRLFTGGKGIRTRGGDIQLDHKNFPQASFDNRFVIGSTTTPQGVYNLDAGSGIVTIISEQASGRDTVVLFDNAIRARSVIIRTSSLTIDNSSRRNGNPEIIYSQQLKVGPRGDLESRRISSTRTPTVEEDRVSVQIARVSATTSNVPANSTANTTPFINFANARQIRYGNYGGAKWTAGKFFNKPPEKNGKPLSRDAAMNLPGREAPVNELDYLFYLHDYAYSKAGEQSGSLFKEEARKNSADLKLVEDMINLYATDNTLTKKDKFFIVKAVAFFDSKIKTYNPYVTPVVAATLKNFGFYLQSPLIGVTRTIQTLLPR